MERGKSGKKSFTLLSRSFLDCVQFLTRIWEVLNSHQKEKHIFHMKNKDQISTITYNIFHQHDRHNCWGGKKIESNLIVHEKYIFWAKLCMLCWASWSSSWRENYATWDDGRCEKNAHSTSNPPSYELGAEEPLKPVSFVALNIIVARLRERRWVSREMRNNFIRR